ncbi:MAG: amidohydrolase family protein [Rhizobiales bacterium]|nr:amidohydrolase family protein [Hyphomicrobiales bacterium]
MKYNRRRFLAGSTATILGTGHLPARSATIDDIPIIDCHIHLFDANRPQGAPYKGGRSFAGGVALPSMYANIAKPLGIVGVIQVDASPWVEDNLWVLQTIQQEPLMVGTIGNLRPEKPEFGEYLARYAKNPLFRGIRYGNLWGYDLPGQVDNPQFIDGLKLLAQHDLVLETANQNIALLQAAVRVNDKVPGLRIVLDHLPAFDPAPENVTQYQAVLKEISQRKNIWTKLSEIVHPRRPLTTPPFVVRGLAAHRDRLDMLMNYFGENRVVFGSDWPNAVGISEVPDTVGLVREYFSGKSRAAAEKFFWKNSVAVYKWIKRTPEQPSLP